MFSLGVKIRTYSDIATSPYDKTENFSISMTVGVTFKYGVCVCVCVREREQEMNECETWRVRLKDKKCCVCGRGVDRESC